MGNPSPSLPDGSLLPTDALPGVPALCKFRRSRHAVRALRGTPINPSHNLVDLCLSQAAIVLPFARFSLGW